MSWYSRLPSALKRAVGRAVRNRAEPTDHHSRSLLKKAHLFIDLVDRHNSDQPYIAPSMFSDSQLEALIPGASRRPVPLEPLMPETEARSVDEIGAMMNADLVSYMPMDILVKVDRASMANSLEVRAPFLDSQVVELALGAPVGWTRTMFKGKALLADSFRGLLPATVWNRRKQGFGVPIHDWFRGDLGTELLRLNSEVSSVVSQQFVESLFQEHMRRERDHGYRLWVIYLYLLWKVNGTKPAF